MTEGWAVDGTAVPLPGVFALGKRRAGASSHSPLAARPLAGPGRAKTEKNYLITVALAVL